MTCKALAMIVIMLVTLTGCANTLVKSSAGVDRGMTKDQVMQVLGQPADKQFRDSDEAWQYCELGAMAGDFLVVWFHDSRVTGVTHWTDSSPALDCTTLLRPIRWETAPNRGTPPPAPAPTTSVKSSGTGFLVDSHGTLLTSNHVVSGARRITVRCDGVGVATATVKAASASTDLAVLSADLRNSSFLSLARPRTAAVGQRVFTYGYPVTGLLGMEPKFTDGTISSLSGIGGEQAFMQVSVPVQPGNSGGPVVAESGEVVGIVAAAAAVAPFLRSTGTLPQNVNWAVKAEYAGLLFDAPAMQPATRSREEAIKRVAKSLCLVEVE
jgi:S1-C subfamily serine protease